MSRPTLPLHLTQDGFGQPTLMLGGIDITKFVSADGLTIVYDADYGMSLPTVTIVFGPGSLELDFDVDLLQRLLDEARTKATN